MHKILDNFLEEDHYSSIKQMVNGDNFPWFFQPHQTNSDTFFFCHIFYTDYRPNSDYFNNLLPLIDKMSITSLINVRANLVTNTYGNGINNYHIDDYGSDNDHKTAIFYLCSNNGKTVLYTEEGEVAVDTVDNRLLVFNAENLHKSIHQTDSDTRIVLNINYY